MRDPPQQQRFYRDYRQRDHYSSDRHDNSRRDDTRAQGANITGQNPNVSYYTTYNYGNFPVGNSPMGDTPMGNVPSAYPPPGYPPSGNRGNHGNRGNRGNRGNDRGRTNDRSQSRQPRPREPSQSSQAARGSMPPPPSTSPLRPKKRDKKGQSGQASKEDSLKMGIPDAKRDKCGACDGDHDIRYCPSPNTEDHRTKICPICDTTKHAWCDCKYYVEGDFHEQFNVLWMNRRGLPVLVYDISLHEVFLNKLHLEKGAASLEDRARMFNQKAGPLTPKFVERLLPPKDSDDEVQRQLQNGRELPWQLGKVDRESVFSRPDKMIVDPDTNNMKVGNILHGTRTTKTPKAGKQKYSIVLEEAVQKGRKEQEVAKRNSDVFDPIRALKLTSSSQKTASVRTTGSRVIPRSKFGQTDDDEMADPCNNCGSDGHAIKGCPSPCKQCGDSLQHHEDSITSGQCTQGCMCNNEPGHTKGACTRPCRLCRIKDRDSTTQIKDCVEHCPYHLSDIEDKEDHLPCKRRHTSCPTCKGRHWHQDCPQWLGTLCVRQDCLATQCNIHCRICGGQNIDEIMAFFPNNDNIAYRQQVQSLVQTWHQYLDNLQWERIPSPDADIKQSTWSMLRCKLHHDLVTADARTLDQLRVATWKAVANCVRGGFTTETIAEAEIMLRIPECRACFDRKYEAGTADFVTRKPGILSSLGWVY